jgi:hypothetical protein
MALFSGPLICHAVSGTEAQRTHKEVNPAPRLRECAAISQSFVDKLAEGQFHTPGGPLAKIVFCILHGATCGDARCRTNSV